MREFFPNRALVHHGPSDDSLDRNLVLWGFADFLCYVFLVYPLAVMNSALVSLWSLTILAGFLCTCMPVGPFSAFYWRNRRAAGMDPFANDPSRSQEADLIDRRRRLLEVMKQASQVVQELTQNKPKAGHLLNVFEDQINQAQATQRRAEQEVKRINAEIEGIRTARLAAEAYLINRRQ